MGIEPKLAITLLRTITLKSVRPKLNKVCKVPSFSRTVNNAIWSAALAKLINGSTLTNHGAGLIK